MRQVIRKSVAEANNIDTSKKIYHLVVDGNSVLKSSLVNKEAINSKGEEYGAILLFLRRVGQLLAMRDFDHCTVCWDGYNSGVLRWNIYKDYKANRDKNYEAAKEMGNTQTKYDAYIDNYCRRILEHKRQREVGVTRKETDDENFQRQRAILQEMLDELFVRQYMYDDVEGDDLIAYYCQHKSKNDYIVIVSEDRDLSQLIDEKVCVYIPSKKTFVSKKNDTEYLGVPSENIVLKKMICGDSSDNIKGIKGMGEKTLETHFPEITQKKVTLDDFLEKCKQILEERKINKKKPLQCISNSIERVTDGCQGTDIYNINRKIIDLSEPLLTPDAENELSNIFGAPIDPTGRDIKNVYHIIEKNDMRLILSEKVFGDLFGMYERIKMKELDFYKKNQ